MPGRMTIGLYNTYDPTKFREAHRRVLARSGRPHVGHVFAHQFEKRHHAIEYLSITSDHDCQLPRPGPDIAP